MSSVNSGVTGPNFTRYTGIICTVNAHTEVVISNSISECQIDESGEFAIFSQKSVAMATSLDISKKEVQIYHLHQKRFHLVKIAKIGPADPEIICLRQIIKKDKYKKKKEINASKIYSPVGNLLQYYPPDSGRLSTSVQIKFCMY